MPFQIISYKSIHNWKKAVYYGNGAVYGNSFKRLINDYEFRGYQLSCVEADKSIIHLFADVIKKYSTEIPNYKTREKYDALGAKAWEIVQSWLNEQNIAFVETNVCLPSLEKIMLWEEIGERPDFLIYDPVEIEISRNVELSP